MAITTTSPLIAASLPANVPAVTDQQKQNVETTGNQVLTSGGPQHDYALRARLGLGTQSDIQYCSTEEVGNVYGASALPQVGMLHSDNSTIFENAQLSEGFYAAYDQAQAGLTALKNSFAASDSSFVKGYTHRCTLLIGDLEVATGPRNGNQETIGTLTTLNTLITRTDEMVGAFNSTASTDALLERASVLDPGYTYRSDQDDLSNGITNNLCKLESKYASFVDVMNDFKTYTGRNLTPEQGRQFGLVKDGIQKMLGTAAKAGGWWKDRDNGPHTRVFWNKLTGDAMPPSDQTSAAPSGVRPVIGLLLLLMLFNAFMINGDNPY